MDAKLTKIYYSPKGYWKGMSAIKKLANTAKVSEDEANNGLPNKRCGKSTFQGQSIFLGPSLMYRHPMQCTRLIFSSCPMTNFREERRFTSMP